MRITPQIIAHRGGAGETLENTRESIGYALSQKVSRYETDVRALKDGTVVLQHDSQLTTPWGNSRTVGELTSQEFFALRGPAGQRPISLKAALEDFPTLAYNVDIKEPRSLEGALRAVSDADAWERVVFSSFSSRTLAKLRKCHPEAQTCLSPVEVVQALVAAHSASKRHFDCAGAFAQVPLKWKGITVVDRVFVSWCHSQGIRVEPWTINEKTEMLQLADLGVDAVMTDYPALAKAAITARSATYPDTLGA
ncbi:glycerophosphodiester phosphodiesterase family protein [Varibaculum cambriense]|uniref:glycerophosphodiester phosphodiesterase family protein n=1 Tax=Varibaculum cambriense TaxID=184870 RepID=UPI002910EDFB|nr:glycerophosphodiester phosphodiesterase family protein [Varibaculum cambriense]MDU5542110.1 glycerophosphodiester phosphodiesterase family protein [Varibaculum cambriense]